MGKARAEDPLGKVGFFTKLAEAAPMESGVFCRSDLIPLFSISANVTNAYKIAYMYMLEFFVILLFAYAKPQVSGIY